MSDQMRIESLIPQPLPDLRRVTLNLRMSGLPAYSPGSGSGMIQFSDMPQPEPGDGLPEAPTTPNVELLLEEPPSNASPAVEGTELSQERSPSPYPDVELSILDQRGNQVAGTFIIEHKEAGLDFTLHLRAFEPGATYTARAEMTLNDEVIQVVEVPFDLR